MILGSTNGGQNGGQLPPVLGFRNGGLNYDVGGGVVVVPYDGALDLGKGDYNILEVDQFPLGAWDPSLRAQILVAEFAELRWWNDTLISRTPVPPVPTQGEIAEMVDNIQLRDERYAEIVGQAEDFTLYWANLLMAGPGSRPSTWLMILALTQIGTLVGMRYKFLYQRPRPVQVYPALMPCILTPPHPSYPNNHALQSYLIAGCVARANPALANAVNNLADRIAKNREIAGVHFPADKIASRTVADHVLSLLPTCPGFAALLGEVQQEWGRVADSGRTPK
jgi:acid phosphatase (class A)